MNGPALAQSSGNVQRSPLGTYPVEGGKRVERVETQRLTLPPGSKTGLHTHPGPVVSYVVEGRIVVQVEGMPARTFGPGETIFEPAIVVATYLLSADDKALIHMIE